ncbi:MAG: redoxin family protein [Marinibacterium sp.]
MTISVGDRLPQATLSRIGEKGLERVDVRAIAADRKVVFFSVVGAFTGTCSEDVLPSFLRTREAMADKGVEDVICVAVNDPFVMHAWETATGAAEFGLTLLADPDGSFTAALGMTFDAPAVGFVGRSRRYTMLVEDTVITRLMTDEDTRLLDRSSGEALLAQM